MYVKTLVSTAGAAFTFSFSFVFLAWLTASKVEGFPMIVFFHTVFMLSSFAALKGRGFRQVQSTNTPMR